MSTLTTDAQARASGLEEEFEHEPVPIAHRRSLASVAAIWFGFPMILTNAVFGGIIAYNLGFWRAILAVFVGNAVLFGYVGALSYMAGRTGQNFALQAKRTFGTTGYVVASGFLATIVVGWYAFQTGLTGSTLHDGFGWNTTAVICLATLLYTGVTFLGIRALSIIGMIAAPLYVVLGLVALGFVAESQGLSGVTSYAGSGTQAMGFGGAVTLVIATFADSGTMTSDFTRWARTGQDAVLATFTAFPVANLVAQLFGIVVVAAGAAKAPGTDGGDFLPLLTGHGGLMSALAVVFVFVNLGSVCTHCLYNGAVGYSHLLGSRMRILTVVLGLVGGLLAVAGVWSLFLGWLNVLGMLVPPIGAVMITDQLLLGGLTRTDAVASVRPNAFIGWAAGALAAVLVHVGVPGPGEAITGMIVGAAVYAGLERLWPRPAAQAA